jgi:ribosome-associated translation inhibitor RaiA
MQIQVNGDNQIHAREKLATRVEAVVGGALQRFGERISRVEVHLTDENHLKKGQADKRCLIEAHINGHSSTAVSHHAQTVEQAVDGAAHKLERAIDHALGRLRNH